MAIDFPTSPYIGQQYSYGGRTWQWTGTAWNNVGAVGLDLDGGAPDSIYGGINPIDGGTP